MLRKGVYPYKYMDDWGNLMKHYYLKKECYISLNMADISDADYKLQRDFEIKNVGEYHDLYIHSDAPGLAW